MEKSFEEILVQFYVDQYRENAKRSTGKPVKLAHYIHRLNSKAKSIKYARFSKNETVALDKLHQEIKRLALITYYSNNKNARQILNREILPQLVRVDMEQFDEKEAEYLTEDFLKLLRKEYIGAICTRSMKALYNEYRSKELRREIVTLVPARPELEFPKAQSMKRHFILHIGPTNSGKTYQALERLKLAQNGVYLGPLRLLALEVYEKMNDAGIPCTMLTGQECLEVSDSRITASTVEMLDCDKEYDIAVIDEAQMVADDDRGHSWTRAILGTLAGEIHICMSPVAKDVVIHLINLCHDEYEIREYERKTALKLEDKPFSFPQDVREEFPIVKDTTPNMMNPRLYTTSYNKPQGQQFDTAVLSFIKLQYTEKSCKMKNIFVLVTILGHLPVILSAKRKGSDNMKQILIVEDDNLLNKTLTYNLELDGYTITSVLNARTAAESLKTNIFDLVLLDINLPDGNGYDLCRLIKPEHPDTVVIFLTANDQESDQIRGYEAGAVDYITKPFSISALQRKIKAMFAMLEHHKPAKDIYEDGSLFLDFSEQFASLNGKPLALSAMEYKMLNLFLKNPKQVLTRQQLLERLWDIDEKYVDEHTLTTSISRIRSKIEADGDTYIKTVYGMGYQWTGGKKK